MILNYLGILSGLILLIFGADRFVIGASGTARSIGMPTLIIGLVIVGLGTSAPEILVGTVAALEGKTEIAIGNALGSNIANIGLVLGATVIIRPVIIASAMLKHEFILMVLAIIITFLLMADQNLERLDGILLLLCLAATIYWIIRIARRSTEADPLADEFEQELSTKLSLRKSIFMLIFGLLVLLAGAELLVRCAVVVARHFGMSDLIIGLTIIAIGTSLPELATSIMSVLKKEADIAIGNIIGSNMFNMLAVISVPALIHPTGFSSEVLLRDFPIMLGLTLLMGWMVFIHGAGRFDRIEGCVLMLCFIAYQCWLFMGTGIS